MLFKKIKCYSNFLLQKPFFISTRTITIKESSIKSGHKMCTTTQCKMFAAISNYAVMILKFKCMARLHYSDQISTNTELSNESLKHRLFFLTPYNLSQHEDTLL